MCNQRPVFMNTKHLCSSEVALCCKSPLWQLLISAIRNRGTFPPKILPSVKGNDFKEENFCFAQGTLYKPTQKMLGNMWGTEDGLSLCKCAHFCVRVHVHVFVCMWEPGVDIWCLPQLLLQFNFLLLFEFVLNTFVDHSYNTIWWYLEIPPLICTFPYWPLPNLMCVYFHIYNIGKWSFQFHIWTPTSFFETVFPTEVGAHWFGKSGWPVDPGDSPFSASTALQLEVCASVPSFLHGF